MLATLPGKELRGQLAASIGFVDFGFGTCPLLGSVVVSILSPGRHCAAEAGLLIDTVIDTV
jgi:hypothetical protein